MKETASTIHQYLTFRLAQEQYAINVGSIKEVLGVPKVTRIPKMPDFMCGIINLRGTVVPVIDLCKKFGIGEVTHTPDTGIIVTEITPSADSEELLIIGVYSDVVQKVITIEPESIEPPPKIGIAIDTAFIQGMGHVDNEFIIILNINKILSGSELLELQAEVAQGQ
ncbi:MAG: chemotaxis protein CheW [Treponema sp.]|nr:MAG: chemotaxis protein CheW [Treponema sp.]